MKNPESAQGWADDGAFLPDGMAAMHEDHVRRLAAFAAEFGFSHGAVAELPFASGASFKAHVLIHTWPEELAGAYDQADVFSSSALVRAVAATRLPVFNEGCLWAEAEGAGADDALSARFAAAKLRTTLAIRIPVHGGEDCLVALSGERPVPSIGELSNFTYRALEFFESLEDDAAVSDTLKDELSTRELACLRFAAEGKSSDDIAVVLGLSAFAVSSYFRSAAEKLGAVNRMQAIAKAIRLKLI